MVAVEATPTHLVEQPVVAGVPVPVVEDAAAEAESARQAAADARARAAEAVAAAQAEADRLLDEAQRRSTALELEARRHDEDAARLQAAADRDSETVLVTARLAQLESARDAGVDEIDRLSVEVARLQERCADLGAERSELEQRRVMAVRNDDGEALRQAVVDLQTNAELAQARSADLQAAQARLSAVVADVDRICEDLARSVIKLGDLRRAADGLPSAAEAQAVASALMPAFAFGLLQADPAGFAELLVASTPDDAGKANMQELLALAAEAPSSAAIQSAIVQVGAMAFGLVHGGRVLEFVEQVARTSPERYRALTKLAFPAVQRQLSPQEKFAAVGADAAGMVAAVLGGGGR